MTVARQHVNPQSRFHASLGSQVNKWHNSLSATPVSLITLTGAVSGSAPRGFYLELIPAFVLCSHYSQDRSLRICRRNDPIPPPPTPFYHFWFIHLSGGCMQTRRKIPGSRIEWRRIYNSWKLMHCFCCFICHCFLSPSVSPHHHSRVSGKGWQ